MTDSASRLSLAPTLILIFSGLAGAAADRSCSSVLATVLNAEADRNRRSINAAGGREYLTAHLAAKTRASLK